MLWMDYIHGSHTSGQNKFKYFLRIFQDPSRHFFQNQVVLCLQNGKQNRNWLVGFVLIGCFKITKSTTIILWRVLKFFNSSRPKLFQALKTMNKVRGLFQTSSTAWKPCILILYNGLDGNTETIICKVFCLFKSYWHPCSSHADYKKSKKPAN